VTFQGLAETSARVNAHPRAEVLRRAHARRLRQAGLRATTGLGKQDGRALGAGTIEATDQSPRGSTIRIQAQMHRKADACTGDEGAKQL